MPSGCRAATTTPEVELTGELLDRVDEIVPPGVNLNPADSGYQNPALESAARRR